ncbi:MAG: plasma-membrane proton-efflux P-type ATPase [Dehalococcoidia bacterium]|nr:plasma-membrane proton-efflux P-type ATPase [Dehalococcoidia bacterium]
MQISDVETATDVNAGLTSREVRERLTRHGYNEVPEKKANPALLFAMRFWGITPWMLEAALVLTWFLGKHLEFYLILGLLFFNAALGFFQENRANAALQVLKRRLEIKARVKRDGEWLAIPAREVVPGDVLRLRAGDFVPADAKLAEGGLEVDQSSLTGESLTVGKVAGDAVLAGSTVKKGEATAIVLATGIRTRLGRTVELVQLAKPRLHMEEVTSRVVRWLLIMVASLLALGLILAAIEHTDVVEILPLTAVLLVSAIPVALPTLFVITMALGSSELARRAVLVTRLSATEDAATMDAICVDKTGTLTLNSLSIIDVKTVGGHSTEDVLLYGALASQEADRDPIDMAFLAAAKGVRAPLSDYLQKEFTPFDASTRRTEAVAMKDGQRVFVFKGAVNVIVPICRQGEQELARIQSDVDALAAKGHRLIAVAEGSSTTDVRLAGVAALYDTPRPDSSGLVRELQSLGISVKMLTGDALPIAQGVAEQIGLRHGIKTMTELRDVADENRVVQTVAEADGFAEVYPEDKHLIVETLQRRGHVVGMTGDGVNDAPALRQAEVGIATSNAVDVAKKAAGVVLTTGGLKGIVDLVKTGRRIHQRIVTWTLNKIVKTFLVVVLAVVGFVVTGDYVVSVFSMVLFLFLTDFATLSISTDNVRYSTKPDRWDIGWLVKVGVSLGLLVAGQGMLLIYVGFYRLGLRDDISQLYTAVFDFLVFASLFTLLTVRERGRFWDSTPSKTLVLSVLAAVAAVFLISRFGVHDLAPISPAWTLAIMGYSAFVCLLVNDYAKALLLKKFRGPVSL